MLTDALLMIVGFLLTITTLEGAYIVGVMLAGFSAKDALRIQDRYSGIMLFLLLVVFLRYLLLGLIGSGFVATLVCSIFIGAATFLKFRNLDKARVLSESGEGGWHFAPKHPSFERLLDEDYPELRALYDQDPAIEDWQPGNTFHQPGNNVTFSCGHTGPEYFTLFIGGRQIAPNPNQPQSKKVCPDCSLLALQQVSTHCYDCGRLIVPGDPVALFGRQGMEPKEGVYFRTYQDGIYMESISCLIGPCSDMFPGYIGQWNGNDITHFTELENPVVQVRVG